MADNFWNERYNVDHYVYGTRPNAFLTAEARRLSPGSRILIPGDGEGRNGVWLAGLGMAVHSVDGSSVAVDKARRLAAERGVPLKAETANLLDWSWPVGVFDAAVCLFLHFPEPERIDIHARMARALRPGGLVILETFRPAQLAYASGGPRDVALLYTPDQLRADFAGLDILLLEEAEPVLDEGPLHQGQGATVRLVARKPE
ncbi:MAG: methyltransferase domain-containing protein [Telmatospirillum sp.]|nr:methyltransferase domain-containing protein [Telmatospirillum sp.]